MNRLVPPLLLAAFCALAPAFAKGDQSPVLNCSYEGQGGALQAVDSLWPAQIIVNTRNAAELVYVDWWEDDAPNNVVRVFLEGAETHWEGSMPVNHAGTARFFIWVEGSDGIPVRAGDSDPDEPYSYTISEGTTDPKSMTRQRCPDISEWGVDQTKKLTGTTDWYGEELSGVSSCPQMIRLLGTTTAAIPYATKGRSSPVAGGFVRTALGVEDGVGSIWFKARMANASASGGVLVIDKVSYNMVNNKPKFIDPPTEIVSINVPPALSNDQWYQFHLVLQNASTTNVSFRIRNKTMAADEEDRTTKAIDVCDIMLTPIIPDVKILKDGMDYDPGYPSILDPVAFHITVSNLYAAAPAQYITPRLVWRQGDLDKWKEKVMEHAADDGGRKNQAPGTFHCTLSDADGLVDGPFEYFYTVSFAGYTPKFPALKYPDFDNLNDIQNARYDGNGKGNYKYVIDTDAWALLTDEEGTVSECRAPAYHPDFSWLGFDRGIASFQKYGASGDVVTNSPADFANSGSRWGFTRMFDLRNLDEGWPVARKAHFAVRVKEEGASTAYTVFENRPIEIEHEYPYHTFMAADGVRRFRSLYTGLAAVTADWTDEEPSHLEGSYAMQHVGDYTWQSIIHVTNAVDALFSVTGGLYAAEGGTNFVAGPFEWLQLHQDPTSINPPMSGAMEVSVQNGVVVTNHSELQRFTMHEENRIERIPTEVPYQETNKVSGAGWFVGVVDPIANPFWYDARFSVTNAAGERFWTNETGEVVAPGVGDVAFWYGVLGTEPGEETWDEALQQNVIPIETNIVSDILWNEVVETNVTWHGDGMTAETNEVRRLVPRSAYNQYFEWEDRVTVTNVFSAPIVTNAVITDRTRTEWAEVSTTVWVPDTPLDLQESDLRTRVQIDYDGFLMFRFCTTNGSYQIRRAAWQDFNEWQAAETNYSISFGLYGVKDFGSDLTGRAPTVFGSLEWALAENLAPTAEWSDASDGEYMDGMLGKNVRVVTERLRRDKDVDEPESQNRNRAFLLASHPDAMGSLQTTSALTQNGRDTLRVRLRSSTDDARSIVWKGCSLDATDYRVMARVTEQSENQVSDGEHSLSLIGYWQSPYDYWEARIVQRTYLSGDGAKPHRNWFDVHIYKWVDGECEEVFGNVSQKGMSAAGARKSPTDSNTTGGDDYAATSSNPATFPGWKNSGTATRNYNYWDGSSASGGTFLRVADGGGYKGWTFTFTLSTAEGGDVTPVVRAYLTEDLEKAQPKLDRYFEFAGTATSTSNGGTASGRPGYNMRDCGLVIVPFVQDKNADPCILPSVAYPGSGVGPTPSAFMGIKTATANDWYLSDSAIYDSRQKINVWNVRDATVSGTGVKAITRKPPVVYYGVEVFRMMRETETNLFTAPVRRPSDWNAAWDDYHRSIPGAEVKDGIRSVSSWRWVDEDFPMNFWDEAFVNIRTYAADGDQKSLAMLAVDAPVCADWRGKTVWDPANTEPDARAKARSELGSGWTATYAAIVADGRTGRKYELDRSRANPNRIQAITSPMLEDGVGDITFRCQARNHRVKVSVERGDASGFWFSDDERTVEIAPSTAPIPLYFLFATNIPGRIRIRVLDPDGMGPGELGTLDVDDIRATDYPAHGESSWEAYNLLVSSFPTNYTIPRGWERTPKFDGVSSAAEKMRSAVLNDGVARETLSGLALAAHRPYLQTPSIETGVGEISFWYRASPENAVGDEPPAPAKIRLMVAESSRVPDEEWRELTFEDLTDWDSNTYQAREEDPDWVRQKNALDALSAITNETTWNYFSVEFYDDKDRVLRIVGDTNGAPNRVMLDNVLITEPVRSSIDVGSIEFDPDIPLNTRSTGAKVRLVNPRMNPHDIHVYLDWYVADTKLVEYGVPYVHTRVEEKTTTMHTNIVWNGQTYDATFPVKTYTTETFVRTETTLVSKHLRDDGENRKWGYERWKDLQDGNNLPEGYQKGTIGFTNAPGDAYTFFSTNRIPTDRWPADTAFQYCVRVVYRGAFSEDRISETQGRVKNGYWFDNPPWYEPTDLNGMFGTTETPVSHAFVFTCTTNVVRFNEVRPWLGPSGDPTVNAQDAQFIELIGPEGAIIEDWRIEHWWDELDDALVWTSINYTNVLRKGARFKASSNTNSVPPKRWGFYILGCSGIANRDQELFPLTAEQSVDDQDGHPFIDPYAAMRLRRPMGAYVDSITFGAASATKPMRELGFANAGNITSPNSKSRRGYVYYLDASNDALSWKSGSSKMESIGGYNSDEESVLPWLDEDWEPPPGPLVGPPVITGFTFEGAADGYANLWFRVSVTNGVALDADSGYDWIIQRNTDLDESGWSFAERIDPRTKPVVAPADGTPVDIGPIEVPTAEDTLFYRIKAVPGK